ncbi:MFS transporter [Comamonas testosteroni]|uniref:MFS transporter n=1 Tax=Comamonas testosteroni TaxID=285 RepID=A0A0L7N918_COMTE|nr:MULTISPECIES: MFS transporter [Comamonas]KOC30702.1 MFS transporter [Comamonas testosteroni]KWT65624.1 major facilitator superfamily MFS_1 [Comamonas testosteroni]MDN5505975.1 MFS transporter [Comamonas sp.]MDN5539644.1 MFS transporter [Comamonas sp.]
MSSDHSAAEPAPNAGPKPDSSAWAMLVCLLTGFALSQAFRTITSIIADGLRTDFGLSAQSLGSFAGLFALSFGVAQLLMGIGMDIYGLRRTVLLAFPLSIAGAALSALAPSYSWLMLGQLLIGVGCSPAFLASTMFIARHFPADKFAYLSGIGLGLGGLGLLFTGTPMAWLVQHMGWRAGFALLAVLSVLSWLLIFFKVHEPELPGDSQPKPGFMQALQGFGSLLLLPHTWGIVLLGMVSYASFLTVRGLWLSPMLMDRYQFSLVTTGNVALACSVISLFVPSMFGRLDPGPARRRQRIARFALLMAAVFVALALVHQSVGSVLLLLVMSVLSGYGTLIYADVRSSYPPATTGRALSIFTMAMFLGAALMQWLSGLVAGVAERQNADIYQAVMLMIAAMLGSGVLAYQLIKPSPLLLKASH